MNGNDYDALAIPSGFEKAGFDEDAHDERLQNLTRDFDRQGKIIELVCGAALPIAKAGVVKGRNATPYDLLDGIGRKQLAELGAIVE